MTPAAGWSSQKGRECSPTSGEAVGVEGDRKSAEVETKWNRPDLVEGWKNKQGCDHRWLQPFRFSGPPGSRTRSSPLPKGFCHLSALSAGIRFCLIWLSNQVF